MAPNTQSTAANPNGINAFPFLKAHQLPAAYVHPLKKNKNMETRARAGRHHGSLNFGNDLSNALYAFGAPTHPDITNPLPDSESYLRKLPTQNTQHRPTPFTGGPTPTSGAPFPETLRVLDEIVTDFIIEVCHEAVDHATYQGRHKVNPSDIQFVFRNNRAMLGRIRGMTLRSKENKKLRSAVDMDGPTKAGKMTVEQLIELGEAVGEEGTGRGKGRGRGRRKRKLDQIDGAAEVGSPVAGGEADGEGDGSEGDDDADGDGERSAKRARSEIT
jgi:hypothetical protein